ncbi:MAG: hypothetical protein U9R36_04580, partial [Elusimicrobiota bacterium]|nr:hypothetical protein [Elusimicrobiota bacterium]
MKKIIIILIVIASIPFLSGSRVVAAGNKHAANADGTVNEKTGKQNSNGKSNEKGKGNKIIKEKDKLIIKNQKGKVVKEISLKSETKVEIEPKDLSWNLKKEKQNVKKETRKNVVLSKNEKFAAIVKNEKNISVFENGKEISARGEGAVTGEVVVLNSAGKVLF